MNQYLIVGSGFSGSVVANILATTDCNITILEERNHIAGNSYTEKDFETGITIHKYGPHIFHTSNHKVWNYINQFSNFKPYTNRVKSVYKNNVYSLPINLHTINQFFGLALKPEEAKKFIEEKGDKSIVDPTTFEEQALKFVGRELYHAFFYGYTKKQWGCEPRELPASILKRLPIRFNYDDNYYNDIYQGIPENGYTDIVEKMLALPNIKVILNTKFSPFHFDISSYTHIFYTGAIDSFFDYKFGRLGYRTVYFKKHSTHGDYQGNAVINYSDELIPYTRVHEHKHFTPWEQFPKTVYFEEYSKETEGNDIPYYPKRMDEDMQKYSKYLEETRKLKNITFLGRLGTYKYMDMHQVIEEALDIAGNYKANRL